MDTYDQFRNLCRRITPQERELHYVTVMLVTLISLVMGLLISIYVPFFFPYMVGWRVFAAGTIIVLLAGATGSILGMRLVLYVHARRR